MAAKESREAWKAKTRSLWATGGAGGRESGTAASGVVGGVWIVVSLPSLETRSRGEVRAVAGPLSTCDVVVFGGCALSAGGAGSGEAVADVSVLAGGENGRGISSGGRGGGGRDPCTSGW